MAKAADEYFLMCLGFVISILKCVLVQVVIIDQYYTVDRGLDYSCLGYIRM